MSFKSVRIILFIQTLLLVYNLSPAQNPYNYTPESFEESVWANAASSFNSIQASSGTWKVAKNNIQSNAVTAQSGSFSLVFATKTIALTTPRLENGAGTLTFYAIKTGTRTITIETSTDSTTWAAASGSPVTAQSAWTKHTININNPNVRFIRFTSNSNGGLYLDNMLITDASPAGMITSTTAPGMITQTTILANGNVTNSGSAVISSRGFCYNKTGAPDINSPKIEVAGTTGDFSATLSGLDMGSTYYIKAYAITDLGVSYGLSVKGITRDPDAPADYWTQPFDNTAYFPASAPTSPVTINVPDQGDWIYYNAYKSTNPLYIPDGSAYAIRMPKGGSYLVTPLLSDGVTQFTFYEGRGDRSITIYTSENGGSAWTTLQTVTTVKGEPIQLKINSAAVNRIKLANNSDGDADIDNITVSVFPTGTVPTLTTSAVSDVQQNSVLAGGEVTDAGNKTMVERGICWSLVTTPIIADNKVPAGNGTGSFSVNISQLPAGTTIHLRSYAISHAGTGYGNEVIFNTLPATIPVITTTVASIIKGEYAISGGNISNGGGAAITQRGLCWNTTGNPTIADSKSVEGTGVGLFSDSLTHLSPLTQYYYCAYATNIAGTGYGAIETLTTGTIGLPSVTTASVSTPYSYKATMGGTVTDDGGAMLTRGVCWNTTGSPTIADSKAVMGSGGGSFSGEVNGLSENMRYYVRAFATSSLGTYYGDEETFDTPISNRLTRPIGYGRFTTGGGTPTENNTIIVTSASELVAALNGPKSVILVSGTITTSRIAVMLRDKTIIGLSGARLVNLDQTAAGSGILHLTDGSRNVIIQNLIFEGPGAYDEDGWDLLSNKGCYNLWVDHCDFQDGMDDCFDNTNLSDSITVSWCKFSYNKPARAGGSGGSNDHRFANLIGGSDSDTPTDGLYNITWQNCWWAEGCKARMVRGRNVDIHILNCYWNSSVASDAIGLTAGTMGCKVYVEGGHFDLPATTKITDLGSGSIAINFVDCINGKPNYGTVSKPNYEYTALSSSEVKNTLTNSCGAGATLLVSPTGEVYSGCPTIPILTLTQTSGEPNQEVYSGNSITNIVYSWGGTATNADVTNLPAGLLVTKDQTNQTLTISGIPTSEGTYTVTTSGGAGLPASRQGTITITTIAPATLTSSGTLNQVVSNGGAISEIQFTWGGGATDVTISGLANGLSAEKNSTNKTLTISGIPTTSKGFTVTTVGGSGDAVSISGTVLIKYTSTPVKVGYVTNPASVTYANDTRILPALKTDPNFEVTEISSANSTNDYTPYDVVIFSEVAASDDPGVLQLRGLNKPFIMMKVHAYKVATGAWGWANAGYGQSATDTYLSVSDKKHPIFKDVTWVNDNQVQVLSVAAGSKSITYMDPSQFKRVSGSILSLATVVGQPSQVSIFQAPAGTTIAGTSLSQNFIQIGINSNSYGFVTDDGISIVKNACLYLMNAITTSVVNPDRQTKLTVFPVPAKEVIHVIAESKIESVKLVSLDGRTMSETSADAEKADIPVSNIKPGIYILSVKTQYGLINEKVQIIK